MLILSLLTFFFFNDTATTEIYTLSLHDALPICCPLSNAAAMSSCRSSNGSQPRWNFSHAWRLEARSQPLVRRTPPTSQKSAVISPTHRLLQHLKTPGKIFAQVDAQRAPVPLG